METKEPLLGCNAPNGCFCTGRCQRTATQQAEYEKFQNHVYRPRMNQCGLCGRDVSSCQCDFGV